MLLMPKHKKNHNHVGENTEISFFSLAKDTYFAAVHLSPAPGVAFKQEFRQETRANQALNEYPETNNAIDWKKTPSQKPR